ncbi:MAG: glycosyltransferase family 4 protein, partial [Anaerolineaceae bacterium]|nr:glycosyltransferase family 4 protein [Anaerolineaceae bacterium]
MHILLIHQAFTALDEAGGTRHFELAQHLVRRNHRVTIITSPVSYLTGKARSQKIPWEEVDTSIPGITVIRSYTYPALHRSFVTRIFSFFSFMVSSFIVGSSLRDVDLIWGTTPPIFQCLSAWLLARLKRLPFLLEVRDLWPAFAIAVGVLRNPILIAASRFLEKFLYRHATQVIVNSPGFIEYVRQRGARHVELIANSADPAMFDPTAHGHDFRHEYRLENQFIVLYAGAHGMSNDLGVVLKAAELLRANDRITFVLVGDGKDKPLLQHQAQAIGLTNLIFLSPFPKNEMKEVFAASDACIAILLPLELYKT